MEILIVLNAGMSALTLLLLGMLIMKEDDAESIKKINTADLVHEFRGRSKARVKHDKRPPKVHDDQWEFMKENEP